ncbi:MAG: hypothetical protein LBB76_09400 [Azoarcus sp.]|jgi:hypothetical protein|nr:hypothetical protein [Azoarcus sp.]
MNFARYIDDIDMYFKQVREQVDAGDPDPVIHLMSIESSAAHVECAAKLLQKHCSREIKKAIKRDLAMRMAARESVSA